MKNTLLTELIIKCTITALEEGGLNKNVPITADTQLYGKGGVLDSLGLVRVIADLEEEIYENISKSITLADEKAMSQKSSPFRSVSTLSVYIEKLLEAEE
jgi:acyl carrier protein